MFATLKIAAKKFTLIIQDGTNGLHIFNAITGEYEGRWASVDSYKRQHPKPASRIESWELYSH